CQQDYSSPWTF
nr:immunoglobulin light chain junction region [Mus musculus]